MDKNVTADRLRKICDSLYYGNASAMASDMGWGYSTLTRYLSGKASPPARLLMALSRGKNIRLKWLEGEGGGEIEFDEVVNSGGSLYTRPVVTVPFDHVPTDEDLGLTRLSRETSRFHCKPEHYWLRVDRMYKSGTVIPGDYVMVRMFPKGRAKEVDVGKLFILNRGENVVLAEVSNDDVTDGVAMFGKVVLIERDAE